MDALKYILEKFKIDPATPSPVMIPIGRFKDLPRLFHELGFKVGAEVGVYRGRYSRYLFRFCPGLMLYGIDAWTIYGDYRDYTPADISDAEREAREVAKTHNFVLIKGWSHEAAIGIADESLDFVFLDANHAYEFAVRDIAVWSKKVKKGGIVSGHDFDDYSKHATRSKEMNVVNAVEGWMKSYQIDPWFVITNNRNKCWFYVKK